MYTVYCHIKYRVIFYYNILHIHFTHTQVHAESLEWLKEALNAFGFLINLKPHIDYIKKGFGASNPAGVCVRVSGGVSE